MRYCQLILFLLISFTGFSTGQISDKLIIEKDTINLQVFPLEQLRLKQKIKTPPFDKDSYNMFTTACWRGYSATWEIVDGKLMLIEVQKIDSIYKMVEKLDIVSYLKKIGYQPKLINGVVFANWYSDTLSIFNGLTYYFNPDRLYLEQKYFSQENNTPQLIFSNGLVTDNKIKPLTSFVVGKKLTREISYYRHWLLKRGIVKVEAEIVETDNNRVCVKINNYGTKNRFTLKKVRQLMKVQNDNKYWVNPRYWTIIE